MRPPQPSSMSETTSDLGCPAAAWRKLPPAVSVLQTAISAITHLGFSESHKGEVFRPAPR